MKKLILFLLVCICLANTVVAYENIYVENITFGSYGGVIDSKDGIYVGSYLTYNITLEKKATNSINIPYSVKIINPSKEVIYEKSGTTFDIGEFGITSLKDARIDNKINRLIPLDIAGIYQLVLSTEDINTLFQRNQSGWVYNKSLPFFFEVKSLNDYRWEKSIEKSEKVSTDTYELSQKMLNVTENMNNTTDRMFIATLAMLIVAAITLFATLNNLKK